MFARSVVRAASRAIHTSAVARAEAAAASASAADLVLNFALPSKSLVSKKVVTRVTLPGRAGVFGIEKNSPAFVAELQPGVVRVDFTDNSSEEYFIPGGFCFKHANNVMDVSAPEGVKVDQIDVEAVKAAARDASTAMATAAAGSVEQTEAKVAVELYRVLGSVLKVAV